MALPKPQIPRQSIRWLFAELVVVVLGILIAFQVEEWRTTLSDRQQEIALLEGMLVDFEFNRGLLATYEQSLNCQLEGSEQYLEYLETASVRSEAAMREFLFKCFEYYWSPTSPTYSGWRDLGRPDLIGNAELRGSLNSFYEGLIPFMVTSTERLQRFRDEYTAAFNQDWDVRHKGTHMESMQTTRSVILPLDAIPRAPEFYSAVANWQSWAINLNTRVGTALDAIAEMENQISVRLEQVR